MRLFGHWFQENQRTSRDSSRCRHFPSPPAQKPANAGQNLAAKSKALVFGIQLARPYTTVPVLFPLRGLCYNHRAVERAQNQQARSVQPKRDAEVVFTEAAAAQHAPKAAVDVDQDGSASVPGADRFAVLPGADASLYCPVCSQRLESRRCKLICPECGYYMSCADYY
jgi:hypothetical protein